MEQKLYFMLMSSNLNNSNPLQISKLFLFCLWAIVRQIGLLQDSKIHVYYVIKLNHLKRCFELIWINSKISTHISLSVIFILIYTYFIFTKS